MGVESKVIHNLERELTEKGKKYEDLRKTLKTLTTKFNDLHQNNEISKC
jgi:uncharacterized coiled-coil protein SlyX